MTHLVLVLCLIAFVYFLEFRLRDELHQVECKLQRLEEFIKINRDNISKNKTSISNLTNGKHM